MTIRHLTLPWLEWPYFAGELHRDSRRASWSTLQVWSIHQHHCSMLQIIAALKFAPKEEINNKKIHTPEEKSATAFFPVNNNTFSLLIVYPSWPEQLFQLQNNDGLICPTCLAKNVTRGWTRFVLNFLLNKDSHQKQICFEVLWWRAQVLR